MQFRRIGVALTFIGLSLGVVSIAWSATPARRGATPARAARPFHTEGNDQDRRIDINSINMWVTNFGSFAYDLATGNAGLVYPNGTAKTAVFASGLWLGCTVGPDVRIAVAEYSQEYGPGKMVGGTADDPNRPAYKVYKVARFAGDPADTTHVTRSAAYPADELVHHSWSEYIAGAAPYGAPLRTYRLPYQDVVAPADTDSVDVVGPDVLGDQMLWTVYNDADASLHQNGAGQTAPLGVEVQQTTFGFNRQGALGNTVFVKFKFINAGSDTLKNMFASLWADPDLGGFTDDLVGCDTTLSLGFCYNATNNDQLYGASPPAVGYDFFQGPKGPGGTPLPLTSFNKYINGTDPGSFDETYNYMQGFQPDGSDLIDPLTGLVTKFFHPGDPVTGAGWLDSNPADRRFLLNSGPFTMAPGDTQEVVGAIIIGQGKNRLSSVASLKFFDTFAQAAFDSAFNLPSPPPQPKVDVATDHGTVILSWDAGSRENYHQPGYKFEGYNVYQGSSVSGPWTLLATYDETTPPAVVFDEVFDVETGQIIPLFPVAFGSNIGVRFTHTITQDVIKGGNLRDGTEYFFAVTSYSFNEFGKPKVLENPQATLRVIPQRAAGGTDYGTATSGVSYRQLDTTKPPATDVVTTQVIDPNQVTGHVYKITFEPTPPPPTTVQVGTDTATVLNSWSLTDSTTNTILLSGQLNRRGDDDYQVVDGIKFVVTGKYFVQLQDAFYTNVGPNRRALAGANFGMSAFGGGAGYPVGFVGNMASSIDPTANPDSFTTVELRFNTTSTQSAYRYFRLENLSDGGAVNGRRYNYAGRWPVPFTAWDLVSGRQLDVGFVERMFTADDGTYLPDAQQPATQDSAWTPTLDIFTDREYIVVFRSAYTAADKPGLQLPLADGAVPVMWELNANLRAATDVIDDGDKFTFLWANPATPNDQYLVNTSALVRGNTALATTKLDKVRVVPNPYYNHSRYELNQFNRIIRFMNLPETCTIRIFNLAGDLVRTLHKTDITNSVVNWDLLTENGLPVGSGVYVFHIDAGSVGTKFGRLVVFMERERLNNF
jgi:hypothetical protein